MKIRKLPGVHIYVCALILLFSVALESLYSQDSISMGDTIATASPAFAINEIPLEFTLLSNRLTEIADFIQAKQRIINNDLTVKEYTILLENRNKEILNTLSSMPYQKLENQIRSWKNLKNRFDDIQETLSERITGIEDVKLELNKEQSSWENISALLEGQDLPEDFGYAVDTALIMLHVHYREAVLRAEELLIFQNKQTRLGLLIDETIRVLEEAEQEFQSNYFQRDSSPIGSADNNSNVIPNVGQYLIKEMSETLALLRTYFKSNRVVLIIQIVFIGLLILAFISIKRVWPTHELDSNSRRETQAGFVLSRPFFASLLIGIIISLFFYSNRPLVVGTIFLILLMISTLVLLPGLLSKSIRKPLIVLFCLIVLDVFQDFLPYQSLLNRALIFLQCLAILGLIYFVWKNRKEFSLKQVSARIISGLLGIFGVLMIIAFIANVLGLVKLSDFLISSTFGTLSFSAIVITMVIILNSLIIILIKGKKAESIPLYKQLKIFIDRRIRPIINWSAFALWFFAALTSFRLLNPVRNAIKAIMETKFSIASVEIFIGGIFSFILIVFFTYVLVRFVKNILKDDWVSKSRLPRGTADAMSMLIRYTIVAFGVYLALNSLGLNLNKIGFLAGALGVGIGFGLQTVVLNFLAGLILSLEQPIHVGDIIEVEQEMGKVTQIGVRASKVLTWNGSEAIIPNGILVSKKVTNWTLADDKRRLVISVKTPFTADPEEVIKILTEVAGRHPKSFDQPGPLAVFNGYESHALDFTLYCWVQFGDSLTSKSEIAVGAFKALAKAGIEAPVPIQKINLEKPDGEK